MLNDRQEYDLLMKALGLDNLDMDTDTVVKEVVWNNHFTNYGIVVHDKVAGFGAFFAHRKPDGEFRRLNKWLPDQAACHRWLKRKHFDNLHFAVKASDLKVAAVAA